MAYRKPDKSRLHEIYKVLPVYPEEYGSNDIQRATGFDSDTICRLIKAMSSVAPVCEENNRYCYLNRKTKDEFLKREIV